MVHEWNFEPYAPDPCMGIGESSMISEESIFTVVGYGMSGLDIRLKLLLLSVSEEILIQKEFINGGPITVINDGVDYFVIFSTFGLNTLISGLPEEIDNYLLIKLSGSDLSVIYYSVLFETDDQSCNEMQWMPNGNIAIKVIYNDQTSELIEIDVSNGEIVQTIATGSSNDSYSFHNGNLVHMGADVEGGVAIYAGENYDELLYQTNWEYTNVGGDIVIDSIGNIFGFGATRFTYSSFNTVISNEIINEERFRVLNDDNNVMIAHSHVNDNHSVDVIMDEDGLITLHRISEEGETTMILLNDDDYRIYSVHDGQVFDDVWINCTQHQGTIVFFDQHFPSNGDSPNISWISIPEGMELYGLLEIEQEENGKLFFRAAFKYIDNYWDIVYMKVILEKKSDVITTGISEDISLGEQIMSIYPNPATDIVNIESKQN